MDAMKFVSVVGGGDVGEMVESVGLGAGSGTPSTATACGSGSETETDSLDLDFSLDDFATFLSGDDEDDSTSNSNTTSDDDNDDDTDSKVELPVALSDVSASLGRMSPCLAMPAFLA